MHCTALQSWLAIGKWLLTTAKWLTRESSRTGEQLTDRGGTTLWLGGFLLELLIITFSSQKYNNRRYFRHFCLDLVFRSNPVIAKCLKKSCKRETAQLLLNVCECLNARGSAVLTTKLNWRRPIKKLHTVVNVRRPRRKLKTVIQQEVNLSNVKLQSFF